MSVAPLRARTPSPSRALARATLAVAVAVGATGCPAEVVAPRDASVDIASEAATPGDVASPALAPFGGEWALTWTITSAIAGLDAGMASSECQRLATSVHPVTSLAIDASRSVGTLDGRQCDLSVADATLTARCSCTGGLDLCDHTLTLRREGALLRGRAELTFTYTFPPVCFVGGDVAGTRR